MNRNLIIILELMLVSLLKSHQGTIFIFRFWNTFNHDISYFLGVLFNDFERISEICKYLGSTSNNKSEYEWNVSLST
jgi:hypothetical protein